MFSLLSLNNVQQNTGLAVQPAPIGTCATYERRPTEETVLYQLVAEYVETFFAQVEAETGAGLPDFFKAEFDAFLECGICPACGARRMAEPRPNVQWTFAAWRTPGQAVRAGGC